MVVLQQAPGGEHQRVVGVDLFGRHLVGDGEETAPAAGEGADVQDRRARMLARRARPAQAAFGLDAGVGDAAVGRRHRGYLLHDV